MKVRVGGRGRGRGRGGDKCVGGKEEKGGEGIKEERM